MLTLEAVVPRRQIVQIIRDPQIISGFLYKDLLSELPGVTHCGEALCCRGHSRPPHSHEGFEIMYLSQGTARYHAAGKGYVQRMGEIFIAYPHELHSTGPNPENRHVWLGLCLDNIGPAGERLARQIRQAGARILPGCQEIAPLMHAIISQVVTMRHERAQVVRALIDAFVALLKQRLDCTQDPSYQTFRVLPYSPGVQRALVYMGQRIDHRLPLRDLARAAMARSVPNFCSQFRREVGVTPAAYHVSMRLEAAREMLGQPDFDITNVAMQSGFSSSQHFSTLFKRAFGVTPRVWKAKASTGDVILFKRAFGVTPRICKNKASTGDLIPVAMTLSGSPRSVSGNPWRNRGSGTSSG